MRRRRGRRRPATGCAAAIAVGLAVASPASAADSVRVISSDRFGPIAVEFTAERGPIDSRVTVAGRSGSLRIQSDRRLRAGEGCRQASPRRAICNSPGFMTAALWGGADRFSLARTDIEADLFGGVGPDVLRTSRSFEGTLSGGDGRDRLIGGSGGDWLKGGDGADLIRGFGDDDHLFGGRGRDAILGMADDDELAGEAGDDRIDGGRGSDRIEGRRGRDAIRGGRGLDIIFGGSGRDGVRAGRGDDRIKLGDDDRDRRARCGRGADLARLDRSRRLDPVPVRCERILRG